MKYVMTFLILMASSSFGWAESEDFVPSDFNRVVHEVSEVIGFSSEPPVTESREFGGDGCWFKVEFDFGSSQRSGFEEQGRLEPHTIRIEMESRSLQENIYSEDGEPGTRVFTVSNPSQTKMILSSGDDSGSARGGLIDLEQEEESYRMQLQKVREDGRSRKIYSNLMIIRVQSKVEVKFFETNYPFSYVDMDTNPIMDSLWSRDLFICEGQDRTLE